MTDFLPLQASGRDNALDEAPPPVTLDGVPALVLTGTIGVGKTTVAESASEFLHRAGRRHALMDLDWLGQLYPPAEPDDPYRLDLALANLASIVPNFVAAGATRFVVAATITSEAGASALRTALPGRSTVVLLTASDGVVADRIRARDRGRLREDFLARTADLAAMIERAGIASAVVDNGLRAPEEVAAEVLEAVGWSEGAGNS